MTKAERLVRARIREAGRITFAEFMELALYDPGGYYGSGRRPAHLGDYYTAPEVILSSAPFLLSRWSSAGASWDRLLGSSSPSRAPAMGPWLATSFRTRGASIRHSPRR